MKLVASIFRETGEGTNEEVLAHGQIRTGIDADDEHADFCDEFGNVFKARDIRKDARISIDGCKAWQRLSAADRWHTTAVIQIAGFRF